MIRRILATDGLWIVLTAREFLAHSALCLFLPSALIQLGMWWMA